MNGRFTGENFRRACERTELGTEETARILREYDRGFGDVDDILDEWENDNNY